MSKKSQTGPVEKVLRDVGPTLPRLDPEKIRQALGAEETGESVELGGSPLTLMKIRRELVERLQSSGGRPALSGATRRPKIPLNDEEWAKLEELASAVATEGFAPSAGQVAGVLLSLSLRSVISSLDE